MSGVWVACRRRDCRFANARKSETKDCRLGALSIRRLFHLESAYKLRTIIWSQVFGTRPRLCQATGPCIRGLFEFRLGMELGETGPRSGDARGPTEPSSHDIHESVTFLLHCGCSLGLSGGGRCRDSVHSSIKSDLPRVSKEGSCSSFPSYTELRKRTYRRAEKDNPVHSPRAIHV
jgi:hypothetical protein